MGAGRQDGHSGRQQAADASQSRLLDALRRDVTALAEGRDRSAGSVGHDAARRFLARRLHELGLWPYHGQDFTPLGEGGVFNVLGLVPGADRHRRPIVLAANFDTPPEARGAGKNAAAVAVVLAAAKRLVGAGLERGVLVALLDGGATASDERGGARTLLDDQRHHDLKAAVVLDRVGHHVDGPLVGALAVTGAETDPRLPSLLAGLGPGLPRLVPVHRRYRGPLLSDAFRAAKVPCLELCGGAWRGHDGPGDEPEHLDYALLARVTELAVALVTVLDAARLPGPFDSAETWPGEPEAPEVLTALNG